ncbi:MULTISPECIES: hypothetical protein [Bradyrhizobium]|uniref:hypothetical protein n=1 Tax=Bradyrhizobium TaxID=374 RepID=UPI001CD78609|nr:MULTISPECIES: hypothetical protein [unclassified Bradyrhizobium]MCA1474771.1 hypothetical protein [Bradyrhizobium sp. NBAIM08]MCA1514552.1 hypothetical protein [Bradyrhizobium sp. NBAIM01]UWU87929.1 hypothetical protein N2605_16255 [Bradyrhizobium sp. CB1024]
MSKDRMIGVRVDAELEQRLKAAAEKDRRKISDMARIILSDGLAADNTQHQEVAR